MPSARNKYANLIGVDRRARILMQVLDPGSANGERPLQTSTSQREVRRDDKKATKRRSDTVSKSEEQIHPKKVGVASIPNVPRKKRKISKQVLASEQDYTVIPTPSSSGDGEDAEKNLLHNIQRGKRMQLSGSRKLLSSADQERLSLKEKLLKQLNCSQFRVINEKLYSISSHEARDYFQSNPDLFNIYHSGYRSQMNNWPERPIEVIAKALNKRCSKKKLVIADVGCGDGELKGLLPDGTQVHCFDLVAVNDTVTVANMTSLPLADMSVDVCVYCLSLMNTDLREVLLEAFRILKPGGLLKIAEIASRFKSIKTFCGGVEAMGFETKQHKTDSNGYFVYIDMVKVAEKPGKVKRAAFNLSPCLYKKR